MNEKYLERMTRQLPFIGEKGQEIIHGTRLSVIGGGGNGSLVSIASALIGFRDIIIIDFDTLELQNMNRSFLWGNCMTESLGRPKAELAAETIRKIDHTVNAVALVSYIESESGLRALQKSDAVVSAVDNDESRLIINGFCSEMGKPLLDIGTGGILRNGVLLTFGWRVSLSIPGSACLECIYLDEHVDEQSHISWLPLNLQVVGMGLDMLVAYMTEYRELKANHVVYDNLNGGLHQLWVSSRKDCPHCIKKALSEADRECLHSELPF